MKELQNFIYKHMDSLKQHKRYLAMLTALSLLVTFIVPLILIEPADSMAGVLVCTKKVHTHDAACYEEGCNIEEHIHTDECYASIARSNGTITDYNIAVPNAGSGEYNNSTKRYDEADGNIVDGVTYSPATLPLYTLLFGDGADWVDPNKSLEENLEIVDDEYFLGFASDFCAFIESDFTAFDADAEGRMFVGGDLIFNGNPQVGEWNYQVGAGDYGHFIPISQTDEYRGISGFASGIIGGKVYRLGTITTGSTDTVSKGFTLALPSGRPERHTKGYDIFLYPEEGAYKRFIVGNLAASLHLDEDYLTHGDGTSKDIPYSKSCNHLYYDSDCSICDGKNLDEITNEHSYLKNVNELSQFYQYTEVSTILEKTFDTIRARSLSLASVNATDITSNGGTLTLDASNIGDAKTVYFKLDDWDGISNIEIKIPHDRIKKIENSIYTNNEATITELDLNVIVSCDDESITINGAKTYFVDAQDGTRYDISNRNANATNNHPLSSNILYNFYNATSVEFSGNCNFNGTIMAPNANVTSPEKCPGHLSGALVAKSFYGGLEFGYRPYRGGVDIFGMTSGYAIPVNKFDENGSVLPGALFAIKQDGKFVSLFESGDGTNFAALPSRVDFTGNTLYERDDVRYDTDQPKPYAGTAVDGKQLTAPVTIELYKDSGCNEKIESGYTLDNVYTKLYLKADQDVNIDSNENYIVTGPENGVYTIHLIKPAESLEITARNPGDSTYSDSVTVEFTPKMALNVTSTNFGVNEQISFNVSEPPVGDIWYSYYANGELIKNDSTGNAEYTQNGSVNYTPQVAGTLILSVKAYTKIGDNYYEVAQAAANQITISEAEIPDDLAISIPESITSGETLTVNLTTNQGLPDGATVEYAFNNGAYQGSNQFGTQGVVGKDLPVKVKVTLANGKYVELYDTITVNFNENDGMALNVSGCYQENGELVYTVTSDNSDKISFNVQNIDYYSVSNPTITYYFNNTNCNGNTVDKTVVGNGIPVYAIISANGLEKKLNGFSLTGKYNAQLGLAVDRDTCTVGDEMNLTVSNAPNGASVVFRAFDANGNVVWSSDGQTVNNGGCSVSFTPDKAGSYTFKAYMTFASNPVVELQGRTVTVNAMPVKGELSVTPNQVNVGNNVELKVYAATIGANVVFTLRDQYGNTVKTFNGTVGDNGECIVYYTPDQAGSFSVHTLITKDGSERQVQQSLNVNENTTTLTGEFTVENTSLTPNSRATVKVFNATNGAVVNVYITYADGSTQHQSGNINNGVYEYSFPTTAAGSYSVKVTLAQNGTTLDLGERKFTISNGNDVSGDISVSSNSVLPGENLNVNITNAPAGADVTFKFYYYGNLIDTRTGNKVDSNGNCSVQFAPAIVGNYQVEAVISTSDGNVKTIETSFKGAAQFTLDRENHTYYGGEQCKITVDKVESQTIGSVQKFTINGADVSPYTVDGRTITFTTLDGYYGDFELYLRIQLSGGAVTEFRTSITMINPSASGQNAPFALRYVRINAEDMDSASNQEPLVIEAPENESISSVRLVFPSNIDASQAKFTILATFNGNSNNTRTYSNTDVVNNEIVISGSDITKIELTPVAGSITIDKCYPTYVKKENKITQTYAQDFTLEQYEEKEIVLGDWVKTLDSIVINLDEISNGNEGEVYYAFIHEGETTASEFIMAEVSNNQIAITDINAVDIEKIKIYTTKSSLTFKDYTISSFVGSEIYTEDQIKALRTQTQDITSIYTLVEQQAPVGYFKENTVYIVEVKEAIDLGSFAINDAPTKVRTTVNVKTTDGIIALNYTVDITNTANGNVNTRTIEFIDEDGNVTDTFTVTKNTDGNGNDTLTVASGDITLDWDTTKPAQYGGYYFDPNAMMVVPVPAPIEYTNKIGLLFRKIDDKGAAVNGVDISLVPDPGVVEDVDVWYWDEKSSEWLIDYTKLDEGVEYKFTETYGGGKYELAEDIHFCITADKEITYWTQEDKSDQKTINLDNERIIRMENTSIPGIKVKLRKTDMEGAVIGNDTNFARFSLHASDGTVLLDNIQVINGEVELDFGENNTAYVENGYLKPGTYYLKELSAPNGYEVSTKDFYFNVVKSSDGAFSVTSSEILPGITLTEETQSNGDIHRVTRFTSDALQQISDGLTAETINASTPIIQFKFKTDSGQMGWGNAKFSAVINGEIKTPNTSKFPSGCNYHAESGGMSFQSTDVTVEFTVQQLCELFDISVENFNTINEFVISTWNKTDVEGIDFWVIENPINSGNSGTNNGNTNNGGTSENQIYNTTEEYYDSGQQKNETFNVVVVPQNVLNRITDDMITSDSIVLEFDIKTSNSTQTEQGWKNYRFAGSFDNQNILRDKQEVRQETIEYSLTAKEMLEELGVTPESDAQALVTQFRKLTSFKIAAVNATTVENVVFHGTDETQTTSEETTSTSEETPTAPEIPMLSIDKNILGVPNKPLGTTMNLKVDKKWVGDEGATEFRKPVNVVLKRKTGENGEYITFKPEKQAQDYITLDSSNKWSYTWKDLPRYQNGPADEGEDVLYYYKVYEETSVTGYTSSVPDVNINEGGTIEITNTADTVDIPVTKYWNSNGIGDVSMILPETLTVKLQAEINTNEWKDIPGKTLTLTVNNKQEGDTGETQTTWTGKFEKLPKGYNYRIVEVNVPFGWEVTYDTREISAEETNAATIKGFELRNSYEIKTGSIALQKLWEIPDGEDVALPYEIYLNLYRSVVAPSYTKTNAPYTDNANGNGEPVDYKTDYARLLQHSLYFYDANMCGTDVAENSALAWRTNCHVEDEVPGGYHDAGDHVMFGLPQGYTASMLGWSYLEFIKENEAGNNVNDDEKAHYKLILERFYDFFVDSVKYDSDGKISELLVQKGLGAVDHDIWCSPEVQVSRADEMVWTSTSGSNVAAEYAAALALGYINFNDGSDKYKEYLEVAEKLYEFAGRTSAFTASDTSGTYYGDGESDDDKAWAAAWLYEATGKQDDSPYKDARSNETGELQWDSVKLAAACAMARQTGDWSGVKTYIEGTYTNKDYFYIHSWGTARFNAMAQTATLIAAKHLKAQGDVTTANNFVDWSVGQMNKLLGDNDWKDTINGVCNGGTISDTNLPICLVTNFVPNGFDVDTPQAAHHRAASGWDTHEEYKANCGYDDDSYALIGALAGGPAFGAHTDQTQMNNFNHNHPTSGHTYIDDLHDYCCNEVAIDYNAGLVGAAAGLYYFKGTGLPSTEIEGVEYGAYGLIPPTATTHGIASPTKSAVSEAAQRVLLEEVANEYFYGMKQSRVSVLADEMPNPYVVTNPEFSTQIVIPESIRKTIYRIEMIFNGDSGNGRLVIDNYAQQINYTVPTFSESNTSEINYVTIYKDWDTGFTVSEIRFYYTESGSEPEPDPPAEDKIKINDPPSELIEGDTHTLTSNKTGAQWVITQNDWAAGIDNNGNLTVKNVDSETEIKVKAYTSDSDYDEITIDILPIYITDNNNNNSISLVVNDSNSYQLKVNRGTGLTWGSKNTAVATVDQSGNLKAGNTEGETQIYVTRNNIEVATFNVTVGSVAVETMNFQNQTDTLYSGGTFTFTLQSTPNGTNRVEWNVSGNNNVSVSKNDNNGGVVTVSENANGGSVTITALAYDNSGNVIGRAEKTIYSINKMTINGSESIKIGKNESLSLNNNPSSYNSIEWTLENNNAEASINGNSTQVTIFGKNENTVDVIAKVKNNDVVIATARKTVRFVKPNITLNSADGSIEVGEELQLSINGDGLDSNAYSVEWTSSNNSVATVNNGKVTGVSGGSATITAKVRINNTNIEYNLTKDIQVTAQVVENPMVIIGVDRVGIQSDITLDKQNAPANATRFEWISSNTDIAKVENGKVTGVSAGGPITITLNAYDDSNTLLATDTKEITVVNLRTKEIVVNEDINRTNGTNHCTVSLADIPSNAKITRITAYLSGNLSIEQGVHELMLKDGTKYQTERAAYTLNGNGSMSVDTSSFKDNVLCGTEDSYYSFQIWWAGTDSYITVTNIVVEYETDGRELNLTTDKSTIRKGESVELTINAVGGEVAELTANPSGIIELPTTFANGVYEVTSIAAGEVTITAKVDDALTKSVKLVIKDDITINGNELMDLGGSQTLTVNNAIGNITWSVEGVEGTDSDIITLTNGATFNTKTGKVTAGSNGGEFTIIATDSYDGNQSSITISITERPKVPELPKDVFLEMVTRIGLNDANDWKTTLDGLPLYDAKGNKYYYYIQESGYKQNSTSDYKALTDQSGHFIYSKDASYMPSGYYNNGILPVENGTLNIATVGNKFVSKQQGQLPSTGGSGVKTYYYFGGVMMLLGIAGFTGLKRRERKRRKG